MRPPSVCRAEVAGSILEVMRVPTGCVAYACRDGRHSTSTLARPIVHAPPRPDRVIARAGFDSHRLSRDTSGSVAPAATPTKPRPARNTSAHTIPITASSELTAPTSSKTTPIAELDTATYVVRRSPAAKSTT